VNLVYLAVKSGVRWQQF